MTLARAGESLRRVIIRREKEAGSVQIENQGFRKMAKEIANRIVQFRYLVLSKYRRYASLKEAYFLLVR